jgi:hypothetical protein
MMQSGDNQIPAAQQGAQGQSSSAPSGQQSGTVQIGPLQISGPAETGLGGNDIVIGVGVSLVLAAIAWFVGRILTDTLVKQFAEVGSAKRAGMMLFLLLADIGTFATFGFLGNYWLTTYFLASSISLTLTLFCVFLYTLIAANRSKRR